MIRNLLATTALATLVATGAFAQTTTTPDPSAGQNATTPTPEVPMVIKAEGNLASNIIGETVYNGTGEDAENIGSVNDIVLSADGTIEAVVIGVGGFLGIGQKNVAIEYSLVKWEDRDNDRYLVVETTKDALIAQEEFDAAAYRPMPADAEVTETKPATAEDLASAPAADESADETAATDAPADSEETAQAPATDEPAATDEQETAEAPAEDSTATEETAQAPADDSAATEETAQAPAGEQATDQTQTGAIDRSKLKEQPIDQIRSEDFVGTTVYGANDENIGEIGDVILSQDSKVDAVLIDVGGFLGIGEKEVAVGMDNLQFMADEDGKLHLYTNLSKEQLEAQPAYDEAGYAENRDEMRMDVPAMQ